jgi:hypothetical protein
MRRAVISVAALIAMLVVGASPAWADVKPDANYNGKHTKLRTTANATGVSVLELPIDQKCKGRAPSNQGDFGSSGLGPFTVKSDQTFTNGGPGRPTTPGSVIVKGKFSQDGTKVSGTVKVSAFKSSKGFDCKAFSGRWSARLAS